MRRFKKYILLFLWITPLFFGFLLFNPSRVNADKGFTISSSLSTIAQNQIIEVPIRISTEGEKINAIGFSVDFSTEILEGLPPSQAGSVFPMWVQATSTKIYCGTYGENGFSGDGLVVTLRFKGRQDGATSITLNSIWVLFNGATLEGYSTNQIELEVSGTILVEDVSEQKTEKITLYPPAMQQIVKPDNTTPVSQSDVSLNGSTSFGSKAQVGGQKGSDPEDPLKKADAAEVIASVKGIFGESSFIWTSVLPTCLLLAIVIFLGIKLYLNEKKRHLAIERIMDKQLGALAALENKLDIVEQKGADGKAQYLQDIEEVKKEISGQNLSSNVANDVKTH